MRKHFRVPPKGARPRLEVIKHQRSRRPPQVVPRQQRLPACTYVLLHRSIVFLPASRAFQLNNIRRFGHHRKSLAQPFSAIHWWPPPPTPLRHYGAGRLLLPHSLLRMRRPAQREISLPLRLISARRVSELLSSSRLLELPNHPKLRAHHA